jgi:hypothetical protein
MNLEEIKEVYLDILEDIDNILHYEEDVDVNVLNDVGVESYCLNGKYFNVPDFNVGFVRGMKCIIDMMEGKNV